MARHMRSIIADRLLSGDNSQRLEIQTINFPRRTAINSPHLPRCYANRLGAPHKGGGIPFSRVTVSLQCDMIRRKKDSRSEKPSLAIR